MRPLRVGLTGGIGSGKTTIGKLFIAKGVPLIDADLVAHEVVAQDTPGLDQIVRAFGTVVLKDDGALDRARLRQEIFRDTERKRLLESIVHPLVYKTMEKRYAELDYPYCILSIPLLIETRHQSMVDRILVVDVPIEVQVARVTRRDGVSEEEVMAIIETQVSREARLRYADDVIDNTVSMEQVALEVSMLHEKYLQLAMQAPTRSQPG